MTISGRGRILVIAIPLVLLAAFILFAGYGWFQEHDARLKAETQTSEQQKQISSLQQQQSDVQQALNTKLASLEQERKQPATAAQVVSDATSVLPGLPEPLQIQTSPENAALPDGPSTQSVVIPEADFKSIRDAQLSCQEDGAKLAACQAIEDDSKQQLKLTEAQRDEWKTAANGGSIWHRALGAAKWFAVGAGTGAAAYAIAHHK